MDILINFLTRPTCGRCKQIKPKLEQFAEQNNITVLERNVDTELLPQDMTVFQKTKQRALPIIYFQSENVWVSVSPNNWDFTAAYEMLKEKESEFIDFEEE